MRFEKYVRAMVLGMLMLSITGIAGCIEEMSNLGEETSNTGNVDIKVKNDNLTLSSGALYTYAKAAEPSDIKDAALGNIKAEFPSANIMEMDLEKGTVIFTKERVHFDPLVNTPGLPDDAAADSLSRKQLSHLGLLPENEGELVVEHIGGVSSAYYDDKTGTSTTYKNLVTVYYGREIDGLPVKGNSRIVVQLGKNGELAGVTQKWTKVKAGTEVAKSDIKSMQSAIGDMKKLIQNRYRGVDRIKGISIDTMKLVMYDDGNVIEPALYAVGEIANVGGYADKNYWITPLLKAPKAKYSILEEPPKLGAGII